MCPGKFICSWAFQYEQATTSADSFFIVYQLVCCVNMPFSGFCVQCGAQLKENYSAAIEADKLLNTTENIKVRESLVWCIYGLHKMINNNQPLALMDVKYLSWIAGE